MNSWTSFYRKCMGGISLYRGRASVAGMALVLSLLLATGPWVVPADVAAETQKQQLNRPVQIGLLADRTGALAAYGYAHEKVARAVVDKINR